MNEKTAFSTSHTIRLLRCHRASDGTNVAAVTCSARPNRRPYVRVALTEENYRRLQRLAHKRYDTTASRLGSIVLDEYLAIQERFYRGAERVDVTVVTKPETRDIDAVIFDMDGVLCDSEIASRNAGIAVLAELYGLNSAKADDFAAFTGTGEGNFLRGVAEMYGVTNFDEEHAKARFFSLYLNGGYMRDVEAYPGVKSLVTRLKETGLKVGVASAADQVKVQANLSAVGLGEEGLFDFVTSSDDIVNKKPAPDVFLAAARGMNVDPARCVVVEDAAAGVKAAKAADMRCVSVTTSLEAKALVDAGADLVRDAPANISLEDLFGRPLVSADDLAIESVNGGAVSDDVAAQVPS